jgi:hypothetical protein
MALIGLRTNLSLGLFTLGNVFITAYWYSFFPIHHPEALTVMAFLFLAVSPSGRALSVDSWLRRQQMREKGMAVEGFSLASLTRERSVFAMWPLVLIWWLTSVMYLDAALTKFARSGLDWVNGYTLQFLQIEAGLEANNGLAIFLGKQYMLSLILSWVTILFEATFFLVAIFPVLALFYIPLGAALHMGMCATSIACFWQYMALYTAFIPAFLLWIPVFRRVLRRFGFLLNTRRSKTIGAESSV